MDDISAGHGGHEATEEAPLKGVTGWVRTPPGAPLRDLPGLISGSSACRRWTAVRLHPARTRVHRLAVSTSSLEFRAVIDQAKVSDGTAQNDRGSGVPGAGPSLEERRQEAPGHRRPAGDHRGTLAALTARGLRAASHARSCAPAADPKRHSSPGQSVPVLNSFADPDSRRPEAARRLSPLGRRRGFGLEHGSAVSPGTDRQRGQDERH